MGEGAMKWKREQTRKVNFKGWDGAKWAESKTARELSLRDLYAVIRQFQRDTPEANVTILLRQDGRATVYTWSQTDNPSSFPPAA